MRGKKSLAYKLFYDALDIVESKSKDIEDSALDIWKKALENITPQVEVKRIIKPAPPRYRNEIAKYIIFRNDDCVRCGKCAEVCPYGVHVLKQG